MPRPATLGRLLKNPVAPLVAVFTIGLGLGGGVAAFVFLKAMMHGSPLPPRAERVGRVYVSQRDGGPRGACSAREFRAWAEGMQSAELLVAIREETWILRSRGEPRRIPLLRVSADYFALLGRAPALGRTLLAEDRDRDVLVLSHEL